MKKIEIQNTTDSCTACGKTQSVHKIKVYEILFGTNSIRLCKDCQRKLTEQINDFDAFKLKDKSDIRILEITSCAGCPQLDSRYEDHRWNCHEDSSINVKNSNKIHRRCPLIKKHDYIDEAITLD